MPTTDQERLDDSERRGALNQESLYDLTLHQRDLELHNRELLDSNMTLRCDLERYAELFELAPVGYCALDVDGRIVASNLTAAAMLRTNRSRLAGRPLSAFVKRESRGTFVRHLRDCLEHVRRSAAEVTFSVPGGNDVAVQIVSAPWCDPSGAVVGCKSILDDVSELKRTQDHLRLLSRAGEILASSFEHRSTLSTVVDLAVPVLADACYLDLWSSAGPERVRIALSAELDGSVGPWLRGRGSLHERPLQTSAYRTGQPIVRTRVDGRSIDEFERRCRLTSIICCPLMGKARTFGVLSLGVADSRKSYDSRDVEVATELARRMALAVENAELYRAAGKAVQLRERILGLVSHDLKSPLSNVVMAADMLDLAAGAGTCGKAIGAIRRAAARMERMIEDLLDFSSVEAGQLHVVARPHAVRVLFRDAAEALEPAARAKDLTLSFDEVPAGWHVACDGERMMQVFANLIGNAIKFTPAGGTIEVGVTNADQRRTQFFVRDSGCGVPPSVREILFDPFSQAQETARAGRGLGLFITRGLIEAMGGVIWCESEVDAGATFHFTLPTWSHGPA